MKRLLILIAFCFLFSFGVCDTIQAASVVVDPSGDVSIIDLEITGLGTYNVEFIWGTYAAIFGSSFDFSDSDDAKNVANEICDTLNVAELDSIYSVDLTPKKKFSFHIPTLDGNWKTVKGTKGSNWYVYDKYGVTATDHMYAKVDVVPISGGIWLFGSGLIGIVGIRRKFKK